MKVVGSRCTKNRWHLTGRQPCFFNEKVRPSKCKNWFGPNWNFYLFLFWQLYLQNYHYLSPDEDLANQNTTKAIENFQKFFGLQVTGHLDEDTLYMMKKPRCGDPDVNIQGFRIKRYVTRGKWRKRNLTYYLSFGDDMSRADQSRIFAEAFKYWSDAAQNLTFNRTHDYNNTDLRIRSAISLICILFLFLKISR